MYPVVPSLHGVPGTSRDATALAKDPLMTTAWQLHNRRLGRLLLAMALGMGLVMAASAAQAAPPTQASPTLDVTGLSEVTPGQPSTATVTFTDNGRRVRNVQLSLSA